MAPIRLRHPKGTSTIEIDLDSEEVTVQDVLQKIYALSSILPSRQIRAWHEGQLVVFLLSFVHSQDWIPTTAVDAGTGIASVVFGIAERGPDLR